NGYTLKEFIPGNTIFAYKVSQAMGSLKEGKNEYNLVLELGNAKNDTEILTVYAATGSGKLEEYKKQLQDEYSATQNTPALVANRERAKQDKINQIRELQDEYYFNSKNEIFVIKIGYIIGPQSTELYAKRIDEALKLLGIKTELIAYSAKDIQAIITSGDRKYDILVIGISVEGSLASIGKLFSNSDSKASGLNFSNIENKTLDNLFAELRGTTEFDKIEKIEQSISKIMNTESFFVPISSPYHRIWVDRNIKGMPKIEVIPDIAAFVDVFVGTSIKENYIRNTKDKSISGFFHWIVSQF
ncbi:hypothetical protein K2X92_05905, partial [Candidatus Gracilibacteria bacterium]|nr:hypothetical protein [Candidatus Gracilibacteria bacterium]